MYNKNKQIDFLTLSHMWAQTNKHTYIEELLYDKTIY